MPYSITSLKLASLVDSEPVFPQLSRFSYFSDSEFSAIFEITFSYLKNEKALTKIFAEIPCVYYRVTHTA